MNKIPDNIPILHIITSAPQNARGIMQLIDQQNEEDNHYFLFDNTERILTVWPEWAKYESHALFLPNSSKISRYRFIKKAVKNSTKIVFHGLYFSRKIYYFLFHWNPHFLKKSTWIEWGADLYRWENPPTGILSAKLNKYGRELRQKVPQVVLTFPIDEVYFRREYGDSAELIALGLPSTQPMLPRIDCAFTKKTTSALRIQVAHNGLLENNQIRIIDVLSRFKDEDIQVIIPLAYNIGDLTDTINKKDYKNAVISFAKYHFGRKAVPFVNMIKLDYYMRYLWTVDVVVFDLKRPCGIGNLLFLIYMGKKVFLPSDSDYYRYLTEHGVEIYDTYSIKNMSFQEFSAPVKSKECKWVKDFFDYDKNNAAWIQLFDSWLNSSKEELK